MHSFQLTEPPSVWSERCGYKYGRVISDLCGITEGELRGLNAADVMVTFYIWIKICLRCIKPSLVCVLQQRFHSTG